jgi:hypothetical protein
MESYNSGAVTILSGLELVRRRPRVYSDTSSSSYNELAFPSIAEAIWDESHALFSSAMTTLGFADNTAKPVCFIETEVELPQTTHPRSDVFTVPLSWTELLRVTRKLGREPPKAKA